MGLRRALLGAAARGGGPAAVRAAGGLQRPALDRARGSSLGVAATRTAALAGGVPANPALDRGRLLRGDRAGPAGVGAVGPGAAAASQRSDPGQLHAAVDTHGDLLAVLVTPASEQERAQVGDLAHAIQAVTGQHVELAFVDQGYTGDEPAQAAAEHGIRLEIVKHAEAQRGFVLLPRRWVVERSVARTARFRRLARDYERLPQTVAAL